jgi:ABC-2 type transport system permease protein
MSNILVIARNELRLFFKNRAAYIWIFLIPFLFVALFSFIPVGSGKSSNRYPPVIVENADTGYLGKIFDDLLGAQGLWRIDPAKPGKHKPVRKIRIPADFTARVLAKKPTNVELVALPAGDDAQGDAALIEVRLLRALIAMNSYLLEAATVAPAVAQTPPPTDPGTAAAPSVSAGTEPGAAPVWPPSEQAVRAVIERPALVALDAKFAGRRPVPTSIGFSLPGNLTYFLMMNLLIFGGSTVASTRRSGVLRRLLSLPVRRGELVAGQILGLWLLGAVQIAFLLPVGRFVFHLNLGANLPGVLLVLFVFAWVAAALGVLIGSLLDSHDRIVGTCVFVSMAMAIVGGCWVPAELMPEAMRTAGHCIPTGWALDALHQLISFGGGFDTVVKPVLVLAGFGAAATAAAARWFKV